MALIGTDLTAASNLLLMDELVAIPTETVYGLAGNALSETAVLKIFSTKNRPAFDPLIVHTYSIEAVKTFTETIPEKLQLLMETFWPGPLTVLLPRNALIPDLVTSGLPDVGVRIPNHPLTLELLKQLPFPLAAPSANPFGYVSPTRPQHVDNQLGDKINYILDGGESNVGIESTIVGMENGQPTIFRLGGISVEAIEAVIGTVAVKTHSSSNPQAPGMLKSHYAPRKKMQFLTENIFPENTDLSRIGFVGFEDFHPQIPRENQLLLSPSGSLSEAARRLFSTLRDTENLDVDFIFTELVPDNGLGKAINDRLRRATA